MIEYIVDKLMGLLDKAGALRKEKRELADNALRSVSHALNETYLYYARFERLGPDKEREEQLARYWSAAAIPLRHVDEQLAMICEHKSAYWINPANFSDEEVKRFGIGLDDVRKKYRALLTPSFSKAGLRQPLPE